MLYSLISVAIVGIDQTTGLCESDGGIEISYGALCEEVLDITVDANNQITSFTLTATAAFEKFVFDDDDTAFYNQPPERQSKKITFPQQAFMKFEGITNDKIQAANKIKSCCCTVWVHYLNSGIALVQGIDIAEDGSWKLTKRKAVVSPGIFSDTGANADRVEYTIDSTGRCLSRPTTLSQTALEAL